MMTDHVEIPEVAAWKRVLNTEFDDTGSELSRLVLGGEHLAAALVAARERADAAEAERDQLLEQQAALSARLKASEDELSGDYYQEEADRVREELRLLAPALLVAFPPVPSDGWLAEGTTP